MSALAEALVAAQRRSLATLEKAYVAGVIEAEPMNECGGRLTLYVVGVCSRCHYDLTGEDSERDEREAREQSTREGKET